MTAGPGDRAAGRGYAAGHGYVRASDADRERVVDALKAAFVQGLLTKDELGMRTGQALGSRTYGELASITAGIPVRSAAPARVHPPRPAGKPVPVRRKIVTWGAWVIVPPGLAAAFLTYYGGFVILFMLAFIGAVMTGGPIRTSSRHRWYG